MYFSNGSMDLSQTLDFICEYLWNISCKFVKTTYMVQQITTLETLEGAQRVHISAK